MALLTDEQIERLDLTGDQLIYQAVQRTPGLTAWRCYKDATMAKPGMTIETASGERFEVYPADGQRP